MSAVDIRQSSPYFRVKRGVLTLFISTHANDSIHSVKLKVLAALEEYCGEESAFKELTEKHIRLLAEQATAPTSTNSGSSSSSFRLLEPDNLTIKDSELVDDQILYFTIQRADGAWEEPFVADYDADTQDMDVVVS
ncbi:hypothetical protein IWW38_005012 [Coemansia aciculifera]|uniref:Uncharacterized protein n=1 Tax=Coemansia aciculifera TaxID=417176 RepID=A0ACC1LXW7_9FUNG|nr:hypothetical protein IWW38_005012 [Coemansia aciculifera]